LLPFLIGCKRNTILGAKSNHMQLSYWEQERFFNEIDVLIVGSGIVGLSAALELRKASPKLKITIVERGSLPSGASTKNAGFGCFGSVSELLDDLESHKEEEVLELVEKRWKGLARLRQRLGDDQIDYKPWGGFEVFGAKDEALYENCQAAIPKLNELLKDIIGDKEVFKNADSHIQEKGLKGFEHMIENSFEGQLDTGKMMWGLTKLAQEQDIRILNGISIQRFEEKAKEVVVHSDKGWMFRAQQVLICTNGFSPQLFPSIELQPARNQVLITAPIPQLQLKGSFHFDKGYVYFRNVGNRILLGGGRNLFPRIETTDQFGLTEEIQHYLEDFLKTHLSPTGTIVIEQRWSGILGVGSQKKPIIQQYSDRISMAVRLGGMGVAIGSLVGEEGAKLVLEHALN
jgi:gamma-glutamylputrescine oxidase